MMCQRPFGLWRWWGYTYQPDTLAAMTEQTRRQADQKLSEQSLASFTVPEVVMEPEEGELMGNSASGRSALLRHKTASSGKGLACSVGFDREAGNVGLPTLRQD